MLTVISYSNQLIFDKLRKYQTLIPPCSDVITIFSHAFYRRPQTHARSLLMFRFDPWWFSIKRVLVFLALCPLVNSLAPVLKKIKQNELWSQFYQHFHHAYCHHYYYHHYWLWTVKWPLGWQPVQRFLSVFNQIFSWENFILRENNRGNVNLKFNLKFTVSKTGLKMLCYFYFHYFLYNSLHIHDFHPLWHAKRFKSCGF